VHEIELDGLYRNRKAIERKFGRLKDFRRIAFNSTATSTATPTTSVSHVCLVAALCYCSGAPGRACYLLAANLGVKSSD
jgi:transposase